MIQCTCPSCGKSLKAGDDKAGLMVACPQCRQRFRLPGREKPAEAILEAGPDVGPPPLPDVSDVAALERPPELPTFDAGPHQAAGNIPALGALLVLVLVAIAGVAVGWLASFIGQWFYLILIFPIAIGFAVIAAGWVGMYAGKVTSPWFGAVSGMLGGIVAMTAMHYFDYVHSGARGAGLTFGQFLDAQATAGVQLLGRAGRGGGINIGYVGSFIYWGLEFVVVVGMCAALGVIIAGSPFCTDCKRWKDKVDLGTRMIAMDGPKAQTIELLQKDFEQGELARLQGADDGAESLEIAMTAYVCSGCRDGDVDAQLHWFDVDSEGKPARQDLPLISFPPEALSVFESLFRAERKKDKSRTAEVQDDPGRRPRGRKRTSDDDYR